MSIERSATTDCLVGLARAVGGAILFALPLQMTMEMWWLGFSMDSLRMALFLLLLLPLLVGLSRISGFEQTATLVDDVVDAFVALAVGFITAALMLTAFGVLETSMSADEIIGKIVIMMIPGSIGASLAQSQFGEGRRESRKKLKELHYGGELLVMIVGAIYLGLSIAPTEEVVRIAFMMSEWHAIGLMIATLVVLHAFVYSFEFSGQHSIAPDTARFSTFFRFSIVGYAIALLISFYILWSFGQVDGMAFAEALQSTIVLGVPAALGIAAARLIL